VFYSDLAIAEQKVKCQFVFPQQCLWQNANVHTKSNNSQLEEIQIQRSNYMMMKLSLFLNVALWQWKSYSVPFNETNLSYTPQLGAQLCKILNTKSHHRKHPLELQILKNQELKYTHTGLRIRKSTSLVHIKIW